MRDIRISHRETYSKIFWRTLFRRLHHLNLKNFERYNENYVPASVKNALKMPSQLGNSYPKFSNSVFLGSYKVSR